MVYKPLAHMLDTLWVLAPCSLTGIGVTSTGHCHPGVVAAVQRQAGEIVHAQQNVYGAHEPVVELVGLLKVCQHLGYLVVISKRHVGIIIADLLTASS